MANFIPSTARNPTPVPSPSSDGRFVAVGSDAEAMALRGSGTQVIDLKGRYGDSRAQRLALAPDPWRPELQP